MKKFILITTINPKSPGINRFEQMEDWDIVIVGDKNSFPIKPTQNITFLSIQDQIDLGYKITKLSPYNHYARKNIGYLYAIQNGADIIYDTDDDNFPYENWHARDFTCDRYYASNLKFVNIYKYFTNEKIWPRGFPLDNILISGESYINQNKSIDIGVWQGLVDFNPDVDAIYRLFINNNIKFQVKPSVAIEKGHYCPFNSQNTFWRKKTFPYLFLPSTTSFRFTDILRGYVAQRLIWEDDLCLGFTNASVYQERNEHDLMKDFEDEMECYLNIKTIVHVLDSIIFDSNSTSNIEFVYKALAERGLIKPQEIDVCSAWVDDLIDVTKNNSSGADLN